MWKCTVSAECGTHPSHTIFSGTVDESHAPLATRISSKHNNTLLVLKLREHTKRIGDYTTFSEKMVFSHSSLRSLQRASADHPTPTYITLYPVRNAANSRIKFMVTIL